MVRSACALRTVGHALDVGCGDGKNAAYLLRRGWLVDAYDISDLAVQACNRRLAEFSESRYRVWQSDCRVASVTPSSYDMVIAYGLYHCIGEDYLEQTHLRLASALKPGGLFVCAVFNDSLPLPVGHGTRDLVLRPRDHILKLVSDWAVVELEMGIIEEDHLPLIGRHRHGLTWAIFEKPR